MLIVLLQVQPSVHPPVLAQQQFPGLCSGFMHATSMRSGAAGRYPDHVSTVAAQEACSVARGAVLPG